MPIAYFNSTFHNLLSNLDYDIAGHINFVGTKVQNSYFGLNIFQSGIISNTSETGGLLPLDIFTNNLHCASFMSSGILSLTGGGYIRIGIDDGTPMQTGYAIGGILFRANPSGTANQGARIVAYGKDNWSLTSFPTKINFDICDIGTTTPVTPLSINSDGNVAFQSVNVSSPTLIVRASPGQTADLQRWERSDGSGFLAISASGFIYHNCKSCFPVSIGCRDSRDLAFHLDTNAAYASNKDGSNMTLVYECVVGPKDNISGIMNINHTYATGKTIFGRTDTQQPNTLTILHDPSFGSANASPCVMISPCHTHTRTGIYFSTITSGNVGSDAANSIGFICDKRDVFRVTPSGIKIFKGNNPPLGQFHIGGTGNTGTFKTLLCVERPLAHNIPMTLFLMQPTGVNLAQIDASGNIGLGSGVTFRLRENMPNSTMGTGVLVGGTATVNTTSVTQNSRIFVTVNDTSAANIGNVNVGSRVVGTSFNVVSSNASDARIFAWMMFEPT